MANTIHIQLNSVDEAKDFVRKVSAFLDDVNIYDYSVTIDGKDIEGIIKLGLGKLVEVELISDDIDALYDFKQVISKFRYSRRER